MPVPLNLDAQFTLRSIFGCHFLFTALVLFANWPGQAYLFYNTVLLAALIWAEITPPVDSELPLLKCLAVEGVSVFLDVVLMAVKYHGGGSLETFALVIAVFHLFGRCGSCFVLYRLREERRGLQYGTAAGGGGGGATVGGGGGGSIFGASPTGPGGYEEFPPSYGAGGGPPAGAYSAHDTRPLPP